MRARWIVTALLSLALAGCGEGDIPTDGGLAGTTAEVHVYDAWVTPSGDRAAQIGMRVHNGGPEDDRLLAAACACDARVEIDGALVLAPEEEVVLRPGGTPGIRLAGLAQDLPRGDFVTLTLTFEHAGDVTAAAEVRAPAS